MCEGYPKLKEFDTDLFFRVNLSEPSNFLNNFYFFLLALVKSFQKRFVPRPVINERIRAAEMLLIDENGQSLGKVGREEALRLARERELDLFLVAPLARPPVARILDHGKYLYEQKRAVRKQKTVGKALAIKGIRLGIRTGEHDIEVRRNQAEKFLKKGHKIKVELRFKGREVAHMDLGFGKIKTFAESLAEIAKPEAAPSRQGRQIIMILSPIHSEKKV